MAGYNHQFGMSNSAVAAYDFGLRPASKIGGVPAVLVRQFVQKTEWHHCSSKYNRVDFYDPAEVRAVFGLEVSPDHKPDPHAVEALAAFASKNKVVTVHEDCEVEWLEWLGSKTRPQCVERKESGAKIELKGQTATVTFANGHSMRKRLMTRGFRWHTNQMSLPERREPAA